MCKNLQWLLQGTTFSSDFLLLPLGNVDIVLGVQWLSTLERILFDFKNRTIEFVYKGKKHVLRGASDKLKSAKAKEMIKQEAQVAQLFMFSLVDSTITDDSCYNIQTTSSTGMIPALDSLVRQYSCLFGIPGTLPPHRGASDHSIP